MEKTYKILKIIILVLALVALLLAANTLYESLKSRAQLGVLATQPVEETSGEAGQPEENPEADIDKHEETKEEVPGEPEETTPARKTVPDFTVYDLEENAYRLSDFRGKPVVLNFWASWCGPCKSEMPDFDEKYQEYGEEIHFVMVNLTDGSQETVDSAYGYISEQGYRFPVYYDTDMSAAIAYTVTSVPVTFFVDADGHLAAWYPGALSADILQQGIDILLQQ